MVVETLSCKKCVTLQESNIDKIYHKLLSSKKDPTEQCSCKCHFGGAVSCPSCKSAHGITCCHCID